MKASLRPVVFRFLSLLILLHVNSSLAVAVSRSANAAGGETPADTASIEVPPADHALGNKQTTENSTVHAKATGYSRHDSTVPGKNFIVEAGTQTKLLGHEGDEIHRALPCMEVLLEEHYGSGGVRTFQCENAASFYEWEAQLEGQPVAVRVSKVNGNLTLPPNATVSLVALFLQETNLTHFTKHTQDLSKLKEVNLNGNPDFDAASLLQLGNLSSIVKLEVAGTALATLDWNLGHVLKEMPALQYLNASSSNLHRLPLNIFHENTKLQKLYIDGNEFISLTLHQGLIQQLTHLNISGCSMKKLKVKGRPLEAIHTHTKIIDLSHNHLTSLPAPFMSIISNNLAHLNVTDNMWKKSCTLCSLYHLWNYTNKHPELVYGSQDLSCFRPKEALKVCGWEECPTACRCDSKSKTVDCSATDLKTVPYIGPSDAEILLLENNNLSNMSGIESPVWCKLKTISADHNRIDFVIPPDTVGHCTCFDHDDFYEEDGNCFPQSLQKLSLSHNKIKKLVQSDCQLLYSLQELHLSDNRVEHLGSHVCSSVELLEVLSLNNNTFSDLEEQDVAPYPNLRKLNLSFNKLTTLPYRIIELMPKLTVLDVSHNTLRKFSEETSTPDTPFTSMVPISLEELDLSYNNLELIKPVLSLKHIPTLKKLFIHDNPWECSCESIISLVDRVFKDTKHTAMVNAVRTLICQKPPNLKGVVINSTALKSCQSTEHQEDFFTIMVGILIVICLVVLVFHVMCQKITPNVIGVLGLPPTKIDSTRKRRYSVFMVHSLEDNDMVKTDLVDPLRSLGFSVAWNETAFLPGDNLEASIEKAVSTSRRMIVVASQNFLLLPYGKKIIERGFHEERTVPGFKVVALVTDDLPSSSNRTLHEIVVMRTPIIRRCGNYIKKIRDFLPAPEPLQSIITFTESNLLNFLWQQYEIIQKTEEESISSATSADIWEEVITRSFHGLPVRVPESEEPQIFSHLLTQKRHNEVNHVGT